MSISLKFCLANLRQYKQRIIGKHKDKVIKNPLFNPVLITVLGLLKCPLSNKMSPANLSVDASELSLDNLLNKVNK